PICKLCHLESLFWAACKGSEKISNTCSWSPGNCGSSRTKRIRHQLGNTCSLLASKSRNLPRRSGSQVNHGTGINSLLIELGSIELIQGLEIIRTNTFPVQTRHALQSRFTLTSYLSLLELVLDLSNQLRIHFLQSSKHIGIIEIGNLIEAPGGLFHSCNLSHFGIQLLSKVGIHI